MVIIIGSSPAQELELLFSMADAFVTQAETPETPANIEIIFMVKKWDSMTIDAGSAMSRRTFEKRKHSCL